MVGLGRHRGIDVAVEVGKRFGSGFDYMILVLSGDSPEAVIDLSAKAAAGAQRLVDEGILYGFGGVTSLIPPRPQQTEALGWLAERRGGSLEFVRIRASFARALAEQGMREAPFEGGLGLLEQALRIDQPVGVADFSQTKQTRLLLDRYLKQTPRGWKAAVYLYPPSNRWRREPPPQALRLAKELGPHAVLSGVNIINHRVRHLVLRDAWNGRAVARLPGHRDHPRAVAFSPDSRLALSGDRGGAVYLWTLNV